MATGFSGILADSMGKVLFLSLLCGVLAVFGVSMVNADDPYRNVMRVYVVPSDSKGLILETWKKENCWNGIKQRKNSWQDGVLGTNCPIPPNSNYTYKFQTKDQIGTFTYFPSTLLHRALEDITGIFRLRKISSPSRWSAHKWPDSSTFSGDQGKTYMFRISNVGLSTSLNFRIQGHTMKLVEVEGSHTVQNIYDSLDVHVGQSAAVLVTLNQPPKDYYIVASTRFTKQVLTATAVLRYTNSKAPASGPLPAPPTGQFHWSMRHVRTYRWNLTASAARPNPQGSFHYGKIIPKKTIVLANSAPLINGKKRYAVNRVSYVNPDTPLKLADYFNIPGVFSVDSIQSLPSGGPAYVATSVIPASLHDFVEVVFQNNEYAMQSWHLDGYDFWVVGYGNGQWTPAKRRSYNLVDAITRHTAQVYPNSWTAILISLDNQGMWNMRSALWERQYLGQQLYLRVWTPVHSLANEYDIPSNALLCGKAAGQHP
ncbi:hypothetical protein GH714_031739 [Hevea brasiliensis]|uniref:Plastocyanin-like domain-containing protein n=1 Tax=Hevea brasiliensis TaxID=3981 RepID=A0A6A6L4Z1_HEVBR|nr:hypothetical protein GH714_031739 [Hevea brasiliensis]